jgi:hypothetical protein
MTDITNLALLFRKAAEVIEERGHAKDAFESETGAVCAVGALRIAAGYGAEPPLGEGDIFASEPLAAVKFLSPRIYSNTTDEDPVERIADWNDAWDRTEAEVIEALRDAAAAAESAVAA